MNAPERAGIETGIKAGIRTENRTDTGLLPFYLPASDGQRFCLLHLPAPGRPPRGGIVYLHPLAEEMNKSRHIAAAQARAFAQTGYSVLQLDLHGCGDSSGDLADARWAIWRNDVHLACTWLAPRVDGALTLWGLRLGGLLALDLAAQPPLPLERLLLWQPELDGRRCLERFLRLRLASGMVHEVQHEVQREAQADGARRAEHDIEHGSARAALAAGRPVEVVGYSLSAALAHDLEQVVPAAPRVPVYWLHQQNRGRLPPAVARQAASWRAAGAAVHLAGFDDDAFWHSGELLACPHLLASTHRLCADWLAARPGHER